MKQVIDNDLHIGYDNSNHAYNIVLRNCSLATDEQKKQFMKELRLNGYEWDAEKRGLKKIAEPKLSTSEVECICNECQARHDKDKCDELVFGRKCPLNPSEMTKKMINMKG